MNLTDSIAPRSDQLNADDLMAGPRTVTVTEVTKGSAEQPVNVVTEEFGPARPYKPSKSMRRVIVSAWGLDSDTYVGQQMTLFRNPKIRFGKDEVGGIQISHLSGIEENLTVPLTVTRGKRAPFVVAPLVPRDWSAEIAAAGVDVQKLAALGKSASTDGASATVLESIRQAYLAARDGREPTS
jgi:hypothetical protein